MNAPLDIVPTRLESHESVTLEDLAFLGFSTSLSSISDGKFLVPELATSNNHTMADAFGKFDIILGRDKLACNHAGNKRYRLIIQMNYERYQAAPPRDGTKGRITDEVIEMIRDAGGRFLRKNKRSGVYEEVGNKYAHDKVSHALRSAKPHANSSAGVGPRRSRPPRKTPPTEQENMAFEFLFQEQQVIFQQLLVEQGYAEPCSSGDETSWNEVAAIA